MDKPSIGRIVHYYRDANSGPMAALVTHVHLDPLLVNLTVFDMWGSSICAQAVPPGRDDRRLSREWWEWPPRV